MMEFIFKFLCTIVCGMCFSLGGTSFIEERRFTMPVILSYLILLMTWKWYIALMVIPVMGTLTLGYFGPKFWGRGSWLALQAFVIGLGLTIFHYLTWPIYVGYILGALLLAGFGYNWTQKYGDFIFGSWLGLIVWFIGKGL